MKIIFLLTFILQFGSIGIKEKVAETINLFFGEFSTSEQVKYIIPAAIRTEIESECRQRFYRDEVYIWKIRDTEGVKSYALLDNVPGKSQPITFLVLLGNDLSVKNLEIIKYREPYGGEVANQDWRKQFVGKSVESEIMVGKDIQSISGATISARSVTIGVKKLVLLMEKIKDQI
ncbi:MAG: FMN-binding protein [Melioribacteraceae bacterium]|nr:FMN-binding protein [Melioribacteraceae bacterium]